MAIHISLSILLLLSSFLSHLPFLIADYNYCFNQNGNYTNTSTYSTNLKTLLSNLTSDTKIDYGFYNFSYGQNPNKASAIGLCRGDIKPETCRSCLNNASKLLPTLCPYQKEAMGGNEECILRYSNRSILGVMEDSFSLYVWNMDNATDVVKFNETVTKLLDRLKGEAAAGDSKVKFAAGNETVSNFETVFGTAQCTPDLSKQDCTDCLVKAISEIPNCCDTKKGGRVIKLSCNIRFESNLFYDPLVEDSNSSPTPQASPPLLPPPQASPPTSSRGTCEKSRAVIVMVVPIAVLFLLVVSMTDSFSCSFF